MGYTGKKPTNVVDVSETQSLTVDGDLTIADKIVHSGDTNTAIRFADADTVTIETGGSERLRVTDAGNVGIGATPNSYSGFTTLTLGGSGNSDLDFENNGTVRASFFTETSTADFNIQASSGGALVFQTNGGNDRMRINSSGDVLLGASSGSGTRLTVKSDAETDQYTTRFWHDGNNSAYRGIEILAGTDDGSGTNVQIDFRDGDGTFVGRISSSSGTVTYGAFTAMHPCILPDADNDTGYPYGTLLEITSLAYTQKNGSNTERGLIYNVRKTQSANSKAVLGAYGSKENTTEEEATTHQALVLGDGHILCNNAGGNISIGDGICSSAVAGIGQKATANPSMIIGIAQEDVTFADDTETKLVAVQYGLQQFVPWS